MKLTKALVGFLACCGWLALSGCIHSQAIMLGSEYPASRNVEVLEEQPSVPYQQIALLEAEGAFPKRELIGNLVEKAKTVGADAIILLAMESREGSGGVWFPVAKAIAIKYTPPH
jgi:hypothetical protein